MVRKLENIIFDKTSTNRAEKKSPGNGAYSRIVANSLQNFSASTEEKIEASANGD
jgi:hypothetical protein